MRLPRVSENNEIRGNQASSDALQVTQLCYERGDQRILENLNFTVHSGKLLQVFGSNGAGKSTLLRIIAGLLQPESGEIQHPDNGARKTTSTLYLGHTNGLRGGLTPRENLILCQKLYGLSPCQETVDQALHTLGINRLSTQHINQLSAGQQRRTALARHLIINARVWLLDEPTTSLDAEGRKCFQKQLEIFLGRGGIVIMATHTSIDIPGRSTLNLRLGKQHD